MTGTNCEEDLRVAEHAVRTAGLLCHEVQRSLARDFVIDKPDDSPVTVADFASQAVVVRELLERDPNVTVIAEESANALRESPTLLRHVSRTVADHSAPLPAIDDEELLALIDRGASVEPCRQFWTLDPIDGTKGFIRGEQYAVALARITGGVVDMAAIACPRLDFDGAEGVIAVTAKGRGVELVSLSDPTKRRSATTDPSADSPYRVTESVESLHVGRQARELLQRLGDSISARSLKLDGQTKYVAIADGHADLYVRSVRSSGEPERIWDHAAGSLVVLEAGGIVTDFDGRTLDFESGAIMSKSRGVLCVSNATLHDRCVRALNSND